MPLPRLGIRLGLRLILAAALLALCLPVLATAPHEPALAPGGQELLAPIPVATIVTSPAETAAWAASDPGWQAFLAANPGRWYPRSDRRSDRLSFAWGEGITWLPFDQRVSTAADRAKMLDEVESKARAFMAANAGLYRIPMGMTFRRDASRSGEIDGGRVWYLRLQGFVGDVPVNGSVLTFNLNHGRLVQLGIGAITDSLGAAPSAPILSSSAAADLGRAALGKALGLGDAAAKIEQRGDARLFLLPWSSDAQSYSGEPGKGYEARLCWEQRLSVPGELENWVVVHDAITGERLALFDFNKYACTPPTSPQGRVVGGVFLGPIEDVPETIIGMPFTSVTNGANIVTDYNGIFPFTVGQPASTTLSGAFFDMDCQGCNSPVQAQTTSLGWGNLSLGVDGDNATGNGLSTTAERNCFYHLNKVRQLAAAHITDTQAGGFFSRVTPASVNINSNCNAFWDGNSVNFFRAGGGCNNTGEIADVMQHEWGHGLDQFTGGGNDGARGEGFSDVVAFLSTHDPRLGPYFFGGDPSGIRNADEATGLYSVATVGGLCPGGGGGSGPLGFEVHCEGIIHSQCWWHLAANLRAKYGESAGWYATERLFFKHMPIAHWSVYANVPPGETVQYDGVSLVDDDNGNLADGTPNAAEYNDAFTHHGTEGTPLVADSAECIPPIASPLTLTPATDPATGLDQISVQWTAVGGATRYEVYRNDNAGVGAFPLVASVLPPATSFLDDNVTDGISYVYRVAVFDAAGCVSVNDNRQPVVVPARVSLIFSGFTLDDSGAMANMNDVADPGETLTISITVQNPGASPASNVVATLSSSTPGVTIVDASAIVGTIPAGQTLPSQAPHFIVSLDRSMLCGATASFLVDMTADEGCSISGFNVPIGMLGPFSATWTESFETDTGWSRVPNPGGQAMATGGLWVRADPNPTNTGSQPDDDHTPSPGVFAWVTGNDPDPSPRTDDVDGGCTTLQSPVINFGGTAGLTLEYWRYYLIEINVDDSLVFEISNNGGANWLPLETVSQVIQPFAKGSFNLDAVLGGPANQVVLRVTACDENAPSRVEALLDDLQVGSATYICEPPDRRPRLAYTGRVIGDDAAFGGAAAGNADGVVDPGEIIRLPMDLDNRGNAGATLVVGTLTAVNVPAGVSITDASSPWPNLAVAANGTTSGAPPHFEINVASSVACGTQLLFHLRVDYKGPAGDYSLDQDITLETGIDVETIIWADDFETSDNGFTHDRAADGQNAAGCARDIGVDCQNGGCDDWQRGLPSGASATDPLVARSGVNVWGNDLGLGFNGNPSNGDYKTTVANWLDSPAIDCSGRTGVKLSFWRWLSLEGGGFDCGSVYVNGTEIWSTPGAPSPFQDTAWTYQEYDISAIADNNPAVVVRFDLRSDQGFELGGWNIDDMRLFQRARVCTSAGCINPSVPTAVGGALRGSLANYDESSVEFTWPTATIAATESYTLYRTTGFRPTGAPPPWTAMTPAGFTATTYRDTAAPNALYYYRLVKTACNGVDGPADP